MSFQNVCVSNVFLIIHLHEVIAWSYMGLYVYAELHGVYMVIESCTGCVRMVGVPGERRQRAVLVTQSL